MEGYAMTPSETVKSACDHYMSRYEPSKQAFEDYVEKNGSPALDFTTAFNYDNAVTIRDAEIASACPAAGFYLFDKEKQQALQCKELLDVGGTDILLSVELATFVNRWKTI